MLRGAYFLPPGLPPAVRQLAPRLLRADPSDRPSVIELLGCQLVGRPLRLLAGAQAERQAAAARAACRRAAGDRGCGDGAASEGSGSPADGPAARSGSGKRPGGADRLPRRSRMTPPAAVAGSAAAAQLSVPQPAGGLKALEPGRRAGGLLRGWHAGAAYDAGKAEEAQKRYASRQMEQRRAREQVGWAAGASWVRRRAC